jgi:hypothetical protein
MQVHEYGEAFELTSNNRVDLNVIVDYAWPQFLTHAGDFVREVEVRCTTARPPHQVPTTSALHYTLSIPSAMLTVLMATVHLVAAPGCDSFCVLCVQYDQDIVDLLTSLKKESVTNEGGMYAAAMPPPPLTPEVNGSLPNLTDVSANDQEVCAFT